MTNLIKQIRHNRILDLRKKIAKGWSMSDLMGFCQLNLKVSKPTAISYIDEAAEPFRKKFQEQVNESN
jgi:hypothetical protein